MGTFCVWANKTTLETHGRNLHQMYTEHIHLFYTTTRAFETRVLRTGVLVCFAFFPIWRVFLVVDNKKTKTIYTSMATGINEGGGCDFSYRNIFATLKFCCTNFVKLYKFWKVVQIFRPGANIWYILAFNFLVRGKYLLSNGQELSYEQWQIFRSVLIKCKYLLSWSLGR